MILAALDSFSSGGCAFARADPAELEWHAPPEGPGRLIERGFVPLYGIFAFVFRPDLSGQPLYVPTRAPWLYRIYIFATRRVPANIIDTGQFKGTVTSRRARLWPCGAWEILWQRCQAQAANLDGRSWNDFIQLQHTIDQ